MKLKITVDGKTYEVEVEVAAPEHPIYGVGGYVPMSPVRVPAPARGARPAAPAPRRRPAPAAPVNEEKVCRSPISGIVVRVAAQAGQQIQIGDGVLVLEAMKMETDITAPVAGQDQQDQREGRATASREARSLSSSNEHQPASCQPDVTNVPGFLCVDHVAIAVKAGRAGGAGQRLQALGFTEIHREEVLGGDQVREVLLRVGDGPNLVQLLEPLSADSPVAEADREERRPRRLRPRGVPRDRHPARRSTHMKAKGFKIIDKAPRKGSRGTTVFFVHPKSPRRLRVPPRGGAGGLAQACHDGHQCGHVTTPSNLLAGVPARSPPRQWEAAIAKDLKGADYEKQLVWKTDEGIAVRPYYRAEHVSRAQPIAARRRRLGDGARRAPSRRSTSTRSASTRRARTAVQELAFALAAAPTARRRAQPVTDGRLRGRVGNHFMEIAKLRAARLLLGAVRLR